jgi:hypothetical protein
MKTTKKQLISKKYFPQVKVQMHFLTAYQQGSTRV